MIKSQIILGMVGKRASGKDVVSRYLKDKFSADEIVFSDLIREVLKILVISEERENISWFISKMRERFGGGLLVKAAMLKMEEKKAGIVILNGIRKKDEAEILQRKIGKNFFLISVVSTDENRFKRVKMREFYGNRKKDEIKPSIEEFLLEEKGFESENEIEELEKMADYSINNNSNLVDLEIAIGKLMEKLTQK